MEIALEQFYEWIAHYMLVFARVGAFFMVLPIIGTQLVPMRLRLTLALVTTVVVAMNIPAIPAVEPFSLPAFIMVLQQFLIGAVMGFVVQLLFQVFVIGGQMVAMQVGLGFGTLMDPVNGINVTSISQLYLMTTNLLFFSLNGHVALLALLASSFTTLPISMAGIPVNQFHDFAGLGSWMFAGGLMLALPAVIALLIVNFTFGVMSRVAPQMNIIAVGFPFTMVLGLVIIWMTLANVMPHFERLSQETYQIIAAMVN